MTQVKKATSKQVELMIKFCTPPPDAESMTVSEASEQIDLLLKKRKEDIKRLADSVNIDLCEYAARYSELQHLSINQMAGPCPKCGGHDRFNVMSDWFFCRKCYPVDNKSNHDKFGFVMWVDNCSYEDAVLKLSGGILPSASFPVQPTKPERKPREWDEAKHLQEAKNAYRLLIESKHGFDGRDYLESRGIALATAQAFKVGFCMAGLPYTWDKENKSRAYPEQWAIMFPWFGANDQLVGIRYRFIQKHTYIDIKGKQRTEGKSSEYGSDLTGAFGWQAVKGPERCNVLIITEGEMNALSLWQAGNGLIDVVSPGTEGNVKVLPDDLAAFARQYQHVIVWADKGNIADSAALAIGAHSMRSPNGQDANDLLQAGKLERLLSAMLKKIGADIPVKPEPNEYEHLTAESAELPALDATPLLAIVADNLTWPEAERMHNELRATVPGQKLYGIDDDPTKPGQWRIVQRDYDHVGG